MPTRERGISVEARHTDGAGERTARDAATGVDALGEGVGRLTCV